MQAPTQRDPHPQGVLSTRLRNMPSEKQGRWASTAHAPCHALSMAAHSTSGIRVKPDLQEGVIFRSYRLPELLQARHRGREESSLGWESHSPILRSPALPARTQPGRCRGWGRVQSLSGIPDEAGL